MIFFCNFNRRFRAFVDNVRKIFNFGGNSNNLQVVKSRYSNASGEGDNGNTFFRNCEKATTEPISGDITGKIIALKQFLFEIPTLDIRRYFPNS